MCYEAKHSTAQRDFSPPDNSMKFRMTEKPKMTFNLMRQKLTF